MLKKFLVLYFFLMFSSFSYAEEQKIVYINGATADPWLNTIKTPNNARTIIIGSNQYFFLIFKNSQNSFKKLIIKIVYP